MRMVGSSQIAAHEPADKAIIRSTKPGKGIRILPWQGRRDKLLCPSSPVVAEFILPCSKPNV